MEEGWRTTWQPCDMHKPASLAPRCHRANLRRDIQTECAGRSARRCPRSAAPACAAGAQDPPPHDEAPGSPRPSMSRCGVAAPGRQSPGPLGRAGEEAQTAILRSRLIRPDRQVTASAARSEAVHGCTVKHAAERAARYLQLPWLNHDHFRCRPGRGAHPTAPVHARIAGTIGNRLPTFPGPAGCGGRRSTSPPVRQRSPGRPDPAAAPS
jgi:hypothetical protein